MQACCRVTFLWLLLLASAVPIEAQDRVDICDGCEPISLGCEASFRGARFNERCRLADGSLFASFGLQLPEDGPLSVFVESFEAFVELSILDSDCNVAAEGFGDPAMGGAFLETELPQGDYRIVLVVREAPADLPPEQIPFSIEVRCNTGPPPPPPPPCEDCLVMDLACDAQMALPFPISGCLNETGDRRVDTWIFETQDASEVTLRLFSEIPVRVEMLNEFCDVIAATERDASEILLTARIAPDLGSRGFVRISAAADVIGDRIIEVSLDCGRGGTNPCDSGCQLGELNSGSVVQARIEPPDCGDPDMADRNLWGLAIEQAGRYLIRASSEDFNPRLELFGSLLCRSLASNDDCDEFTTNACLVLELEPGEYHIAVIHRDGTFGGSYELRVEPAVRPEGAFFRGDVGGEGVVAIDDAIALFGYLFQGRGVPSCLESADFDNDGEINLSDGVSILVWLVQGGASPAAPGPPGGGNPCGFDPDEPGTRGDLGCDEYAGCPF